MILDAQIIPGQAAAGIKLLSDIKSLLATARPDSTEHLPASDLFEFGPVRVWARARDGRVDQIGVGKGYLGTTPQGIKIGDRLGDIHHRVGEPFEDDEDLLQLKGIPGLALETTPWKEEYSLHARRYDPDAEVTELFVFPTTKGEQIDDGNAENPPGVERTQ